MPMRSRRWPSSNPHSYAASAKGPQRRSTARPRRSRPCARRVSRSPATGFPVAIRTALLEHLGWQSLVDIALGPETGRGRPAPDVVLSAVMQLEIDAVQQVVVVGDTRNDLLCGARSGAGLVCGVLTGAH